MVIHSLEQTLLHIRQAPDQQLQWYLNVSVKAVKAATAIINQQKFIMLGVTKQRLINLSARITRLPME